MEGILQIKCKISQSICLLLECHNFCLFSFILLNLDEMVFKVAGERLDH